MNKCLACGKDISAATGVGGARMPKPNDISLCLYCGHLMLFDHQLLLRNPTDDEMRAASQDQRVLTVRRMITEYQARRQRS